MDMIEHRVRERAYYIWEGEGRVIGQADAHWLQAEAELAAVESTPVAEVSMAKAATKAPAARAKAPAKAPAKAAAPKAAAAAKVPVKPKKAPRSSEIGIALH